VSLIRLFFPNLTINPKFIAPPSKTTSKSREGCDTRGASCATRRSTFTVTSTRKKKKYKKEKRKESRRSNDSDIELPSFRYRIARGSKDGNSSPSGFAFSSLQTFSKWQRLRTSWVSTPERKKRGKEKERKRERWSPLCAMYNNRQPGRGSCHLSWNREWSQLKRSDANLIVMLERRPRGRPMDFHPFLDAPPLHLTEHVSATVKSRYCRLNPIDIPDNPDSTTHDVSIFSKSHVRLHRWNKIDIWGLWSDSCGFMLISIIYESLDLFFIATLNCINSLSLSFAKYRTYIYNLILSFKNMY